MQIDIETNRKVISRLREKGVCRPWLRLLSEVLNLAGPSAELIKHAERPWASVTFSGNRHTIQLCFAGPDAIESSERFVAALPDHEFDIPGQLVADATISYVDQEMLPDSKVSIETELLLLDES